MRPEKLQSLTDYIRCTTRRRIKTDGYIRQYPGKRPSIVLFNTHVCRVFYFPEIDLNKFKRFFTLKVQKSLVVSSLLSSWLWKEAQIDTDEGAKALPLFQSPTPNQSSNQRVNCVCRITAVCALFVAVTAVQIPLHPLIISDSNHFVFIRDCQLSCFSSK